MQTGLSHDIKTERREVSQGLPSTFQLVPIGFYASLVLCSLFSVWFYLGYKNSLEESENASNEESKYKGQAVQVARETQELQKLNTRADAAASWIEGSHGVQPLAVAISRSVGTTSTIAELRMTRNSEIPAHIHLEIKIDGVTAAVREAMQDSIRDLSFRAHNPDQQTNENSLDYKTTLVWKNDL
ncbi:MAG: hypothetical protein ACI8UO_001068 [Verrucomicrobiales bacterium]|jgi:hypothetical protein